MVRRRKAKAEGKGGRRKAEGRKRGGRQKAEGRKRRRKAEGFSIFHFPYFPFIICHFSMLAEALDRCPK